MKKTSPFFLIFFVLLFSSSAFSQLRLPAILGSHMVLQQDSDVKIWGWSYANEKITLRTSWDTVTYRTSGSRNADWEVMIKTPVAGGPYTITISGSNVITLEDVLIGEVWLCSGQSNMDWKAGVLQQGKEEEPNATNTKLRLFTVSKATAEFPQNDLDGSWKVCSPDEMKNFSAVGYFFGKELQKELNVPVGMINSSWGGTAAEVWTPQEIIERDPVLSESSKKINASYPGWPVKASLAYNAMIYPITNFNINGALWYQGESNRDASESYTSLLSQMIGGWRKAFSKDFPFYYVQIAPYSYNKKDRVALLRESQTKVLTTPKTGMVVISDLVNDVKDIHPINKRDVGLRLANQALGETYNKRGFGLKSPLYKDFKVEKNKIRVTFTNVENGLIVKGGELTEFYIAGEDKKFVPAKAKIDKNEVLVWNETVKKPAAVRFGFTNTAMPNLFSKNGLPVNLFRTDNWDVSIEDINN